MLTSLWVHEKPSRYLNSIQTIQNDSSLFKLQNQQTPRLNICTHTNTHTYTYICINQQQQQKHTHIYIFLDIIQSHNSFTSISEWHRKHFFLDKMSRIPTLNHVILSSHTITSYHVTNHLATERLDWSLLRYDSLEILKNILNLSKIYVLQNSNVYRCVPALSQ